MQSLVIGKHGVLMPELRDVPWKKLQYVAEHPT
jgi:hypothetical protein